jgi:hypothetical protein
MPVTAVSRHHPFRRGMAVSVLGGFFLAITGAFGSGDAPYIQRILYWTSVMVLGGLWGHLCGRALGRHVDVDDRPWRTIVLLTVAITGPLSVIVWAATGLFFEQEAPALRALPGFLAPVCLVTAGALAINVFLDREAPMQTRRATSQSPPPQFLTRLPIKLKGAAIYAVQAEDHYLRIHTDRGSDLILMRLSQALKELDGLEGAQTHRSWWVSRAAIQAVERGNGRATLTLANNLKVPVSRRYARTLRGDWW